MKIILTQCIGEGKSRAYEYLGIHAVAVLTCVLLCHHDSYTAQGRRSEQRCVVRRVRGAVEEGKNLSWSRSITAMKQDTTYNREYLKAC